MGKCYFEFLEEAFQTLTSEVQKILAKEAQEQWVEQQAPGNKDGVKPTTTHIHDYNSILTIEDIGESPSIDDSGNDENKEEEDPRQRLSRLFTRCRAVFHQMYTEARHDVEFQDRLHLYKIQLQALTKYYKEQVEEKSSNSDNQKRRELTFTFDDDVHHPAVVALEGEWVV